MAKHMDAKDRGRIEYLLDYVSLQNPQNAAFSHLSLRRTGSADPDRSENERAGRRQIEEAALLRVPEAPAGKQPHAHSQHRNGSRNTPSGKLSTTCV